MKSHSTAAICNEKLAESVYVCLCACQRSNAKLRPPSNWTFCSLDPVGENSFGKYVSAIYQANGFSGIFATKKINKRSFLLKTLLLWATLTTQRVKFERTSLLGLKLEWHKILFILQEPNQFFGREKLCCQIWIAADWIEKKNPAVPHISFIIQRTQE